MGSVLFVTFLTLAAIVQTVVLFFQPKGEENEKKFTMTRNQFLEWKKQDSKRFAESYEKYGIVLSLLIAFGGFFLAFCIIVTTSILVPFFFLAAFFGKIGDVSLAYVAFVLIVSYALIQIYTWKKALVEMKILWREQRRSEEQMQSDKAQGKELLGDKIVERPSRFLVWTMKIFDLLVAAYLWYLFLITIKVV